MNKKFRSRFDRSRQNYWHCQRGAAAAEFALILVLLAVPILNVVDIGIYVYDRMELDNAGQIAVQTAWAQCAVTGLAPATVNSNCPSLAGALTAAAQTTSLGSDVTVTSTTEDYCCPAAGGLSCSGPGLGPVATTTPSACSSGDPPGDYLFVVVSYTYAPLYSAVSAASYLTTPITRTAWMRLS